MNGWIIPPPKESTRSSEEFLKERQEKVRWLIKHGFLRSQRIKEALLKVPREDLYHRFTGITLILKFHFPCLARRQRFRAHIVIPSFTNPSVLTKATNFLRDVLEKFGKFYTERKEMLKKLKEIGYEDSLEEEICDPYPHTMCMLKEAGMTIF